MTPSPEPSKEGRLGIGGYDEAGLRELVSKRLTRRAQLIAEDQYDAQGVRMVGRRALRDCEILAGMMEGDPPIPDKLFEDFSDFDKERASSLLVGIPTKRELEHVRRIVKEQKRAEP